MSVPATVPPADEDEEQRRTAAVTLLRARGAQDVPHLGGDLLAHLESTEALLRAWGEPDDVALVGLCHAVYGTAGFDVALATLDERSVVVAAVGEVVEAEIYRYAACDRARVYPQLGAETVTFHDRFDGREQRATGSDLRTFAAVTIANEAEIGQQGLFDAAGKEDVAALFASLEPYAPHLLAPALAVLDG